MKSLLIKSLVLFCFFVLLFGNSYSQINIISANKILVLKSEDFIINQSVAEAWFLNDPELADACGGILFETPYQGDGVFTNYYIACCTDPSLDRIIINATNLYLYSIGADSIGWAKQYGSLAGEEQFSAPRGAAINDSYEIYISDSGNDRIVKLQCDPATESIAHVWNASPGGLNNPWGIAVTPGGSVWVADRDNHRVVKFSSSGSFIQSIGSYGSGNWQFSSPRSVEAIGDTAIAVVDSDNDRLVYINLSASEWITTGFPSGSFLTDVAYADEELFVTDEGLNYIHKLRVPDLYLASQGFSSPSCVAYASDLSVVENYTSPDWQIALYYPGTEVIDLQADTPSGIPINYTYLLTNTAEVDEIIKDQSENVVKTIKNAVTIQSNPAVSGVWDLTNDSGNRVAAGIYTLEVTASGYTRSVNVEVIDDTSETITVIFPNGGEELVKGETYDIQWSCYNFSGNVDIQYTSDGKVNWNNIVSGYAGSSPYAWTVPYDLSENCYVRVVDSVDEIPGDTSNAAFSIIYEAPSDDPLPLVLEQHSDDIPGEGWDNAIDGDYYGWDGTVTTDGDPCYAIFSFSGGYTKQINKIKLLTDTGVGYADRWITDFHLDVSTTGTGEYDFTTVLNRTKNGGDWEEFEFSAVSARYVKLVVFGPATTYRQLGEFQVFASSGGGEIPHITVDQTSLSCYAVVDSGNPEDQYIEVTNTGQGTLSWTASENPEVDWMVLPNTTGGSGDSVTVAIVVGNLQPGTYSSSVRISDPAADNNPVDVPVELTLSEVPIPIITVVKPNGGEDWQEGTAHNIEWTTQNFSDNVKIEYSHDGGNNWIVINSSYAGSSPYSWTVPNTPSTNNCYVRISDAVDGDPSDGSDNPFTISSMPGGDQLSMELVPNAHSGAYPGEDWTNAVDGDIYGWDGTVTAYDASPCYAVFQFSDGATKQINKVRLLTDTGVGFSNRWVTEFKIEVSTSGTETSDFEEVLTETKTGGNWEEYTFATESAKYVKFIVLQPSSGFRQIGEFEVYGSGGGATDPHIAVNPGELAFTAVVNGANPSNQSITVTNSGGGTLSWTASENPETNWLSLTNTTGGSGDQVTVAIDITGLSVGTYYDSVRIGDPDADNDPVDVPVTLTISSSSTILAEFQTESNSGFPNDGWQIYNHNGQDCIRSIVSCGSSPDEQYRLDYTFSVPASVNTIYVFAEVDPRGSSGHDSFWIKMNNGDQCCWNDLYILGDGWARAWVYNTGVDNQHAFNVSSGTNTLNLYPREAWTYINWIVITTDPNLDIDNYQFGSSMAKMPATKDYISLVSKNIVVYEPDYELVGETNNQVKKLRINGRDVQLRNGQFRGLLSLKPGVNTVIVQAFTNTDDIVTEEISIEYKKLSFVLNQNYPNPFNPITSINYQIPEKGNVRLIIYNILGQAVRRLVDENQEIGEYTVQWDGKDDFNHKLPGSIYIYKLQCGKFTEARKMILMQ